jgi:hypothetical protein
MHRFPLISAFPLMLCKQTRPECYDAMIAPIQCRKIAASDLELLSEGYDCTSGFGSGLGLGKSSQAFEQ